MANNVRYEWRIEGFEELRRMPTTYDMLLNRVLDGLDRAGEGYEGDVVQGRGRGTLGRARGSIVTSSYEGILDNARNQTLTRILGGGG